MMSRKSCIKFRVRIVSTQSEINGHSTLRSSRKSFIIRFISKIDIRRIKRYGQHPHLKSDTQLAFPDFHLIGILSPKTLITEQADPLIEKANTHTMLFIEQSKRHISPKVHHARSMCKTHQLHAIRTINIHFIICLPPPSAGTTSSPSSCSIWPIPTTSPALCRVRMWVHWSTRAEHTAPLPTIEYPRRLFAAGEN